MAVHLLCHSYALLAWPNKKLVNYELSHAMNFLFKNDADILGTTTAGRGLT